MAQNQSFQDLMAIRYPQTNRSSSTSFSPQAFAQTQSKQDPLQSQMNQQQQYQGNMQLPMGIPMNTTHGVHLSGQTYSSPQSVQNSQGIGGPPGFLQSMNPTPLSNAAVQAHASKASASGNTKGSSEKPESSPKSAPGTTGLLYNTSQQNRLLSSCEWKDKILWASRMILGGNSINGFLRATATAQRIKKQRARQTAIAKRTAAAAAATVAGTKIEEAAADKSKDKSAKPIFDQVEEEKLKKEIMNPRTAKKIKSELEAGIEFCTSLHSVLRSVLFEVAPEQSQFIPASLEESALTPSTSAVDFRHATSSSTLNQTNMPWQVKQSNDMSKAQRKQSTTNVGDAGTSTLRKSRRKKLPPSNEPVIPLAEFDASGKRTCTKKEYNYRVFELLRFRPLKQDDFVAARLSSRDLWILAKVLKGYSGFKMSPNEFLKLSGARRDAVFRERVMVKDVEERDDSGSTLVPRSLVLPLPRNYSEAAEWGQRIKKGSRVYAMYPKTTSLYPATVIDSTTYCRGDDDIIVVEFDGEEPDVVGQVPKYHIPARFVTLIPREFPASQGNNPSNSNRRTSSTKKGGDLPPDDFLALDFGGSGGVGNFDSLVLDFDAPLGAGEEGMVDFPMI